MWSGNNKVWIHYRKDIVASDIDSARFLSDYMRYMYITRCYLNCLEVSDLQKYKVIKPGNGRRLKQYINDKLDTPFVFLYCSN